MHSDVEDTNDGSSIALRGRKDTNDGSSVTLRGRTYLYFNELFFLFIIISDSMNNNTQLTWEGITIVPIAPIQNMPLPADAPKPEVIDLAKPDVIDLAKPEVIDLVEPKVPQAPKRQREAFFEPQFIPMEPEIKKAKKNCQGLGEVKEFASDVFSELNRKILTRPFTGSIVEHIKQTEEHILFLIDHCLKENSKLKKFLESELDAAKAETKQTWMSVLELEEKEERAVTNHEITKYHDQEQFSRLVTLLTRESLNENVVDVVLALRNQQISLSGLKEFLDDYPRDLISDEVLFE